MFTFEGKFDVLTAKNKFDKGPIEKGCKCYTCKHCSRAYVRHLLKLGESEGKRYATIHNTYFMNELMRRVRKSIKNGTFEKFKNEIITAYRKNKDPKQLVGVNVKQ
jgi:queuine tRNA-ribosyltransferase